MYGDGLLGLLQTVLCMAAYLVLILLIWIYLDGDGWSGFQLQAHFSHVINAIPAIFGSGQQNL